MSVAVAKSYSAYYSLGNVHIAREDYDESFKLHSLALSARRDTVGDTYRTAASLHKVAWHLRRRKDYKAAEYVSFCAPITIL